jgi:hypothetical protein
MDKPARLFGTYQPNSVVQQLKQSKDYTCKKNMSFEYSKGVEKSPYDLITQKVGYNPIFAIPFNSLQEFLCYTLMGMPTFPQKLVLFTSTEYEEYDFLKWSRYLSDTFEKGSSKISAEHLFGIESIPEYCIPIIRHENVVSIINIHNSEDIDVCLDGFQEKLHSNLAKRIQQNLENTPYHTDERISMLHFDGTSTEVADKILFYAETLYKGPYKLTPQDIHAYLQYLKDTVFRVTQVQNNTVLISDSIDS